LIGELREGLERDNNLIYFQDIESETSILSSRQPGFIFHFLNTKIEILFQTSQLKSHLFSGTIVMHPQEVEALVGLEINSGSSLGGRELIVFEEVEDFDDKDGQSSSSSSIFSFVTRSLSSMSSSSNQPPTTTNEEDVGSRDRTEEKEDGF